MEIGRILNGRYKIVERIGTGGMSTVYKADEVGLEREVAVKVLISTLSGDPQLIERFNREAKTIASLQHNSIIPIYYYGIEDDFGSFLVMPMLKGGTLEQRLHQLTILPSLTEVGEIAEKLGGALQYAHDKGVVHRDIKFSNIMFDDAGSPYLMDFGIAKLLNTTNLTGTGMTVGTPNFMPPEQWRNDEITPAVDQYAFSVLLYAMLTRRMPFEADTAPALMYQHLQQVPPLVTEYREDVPKEIEEALHKALSKEPQDRFESISQFTGIITHAALASTRKYSGFFKAPIESKAKSKLSTTGFRQQSVMPNTPTEMVADKKLEGAATTFASNSERTPSEQALAATGNEASGLNRGAFYGAMLTVILIGIIVIGAGLFFFSQMTIANQGTETAVAFNVAESEAAIVIAEATETVMAFAVQSANDTETRQAEPTLTDIPTLEPTATDTPLPTASNTPDGTGTQQVVILTEGAIEQATNNAALRLTGTSLAEIQTQGASNNATAAANANSVSTATVEAARIQTEQAENDTTSTAIAIRNTEQAANAASTQLANNRNSTATAFAVIQSNFDATATQIAFLATQAAQNTLEYGEAFSGFGTGEDAMRWTFSGDEGDVISITGRSPDFNTLIEVYLDDELIVSDDNAGYLDNSRISNLELDAPGDYQLVLRATSGDDFVGEYVVGITEMLTCPSVLPARLLVGDFGRVTFEGLKNNLRNNPNPESSLMAQIPNGDVFEVLEGPVCNSDFTWYRVEYDGNIGWTAESDDEVYWLELLPDDDEPVLLAGGRGLTNSVELNPGEFQVESFCSRRGLTTSTDEIDWFCVNSDDVVVITLEEEDFDQICQDTYDEEEAFAQQDGDAIQAAYRWLCYYYPD